MKSLKTWWHCYKSFTPQKFNLSILWASSRKWVLTNTDSTINSFDGKLWYYWAGQKLAWYQKLKFILPNFKKSNSCFLWKHFLGRVGSSHATKGSWKFFKTCFPLVQEIDGAVYTKATQTINRWLFRCLSPVQRDHN